MQFLRPWNRAGTRKAVTEVLLLLYVLFARTVLKLHCPNILDCPIIQLPRSHYLRFIWALQASSGCKALHCSSDSITSAFPMRRSREVPLCKDHEILIMVAQIYKNFAVLILRCSSIGEVKHLLWQLSEDVFEETNQFANKQMNRDRIMSQTVGYYNKAYVFLDTIFYVIGHKWMHRCRRIVPMYGLIL